MTDFLAAALQLTSTSEPELNFAAAEEQIELAARRGAELVGLPENFAFMGGSMGMSVGNSIIAGINNSLKFKKLLCNKILEDTIIDHNISV